MLDYFRRKNFKPAALLTLDEFNARRTDYVVASEQLRRLDSFYRIVKKLIVNNLIRETWNDFLVNLESSIYEMASVKQPGIPGFTFN